jgi:hypothetical protein
MGCEVLWPPDCPDDILEAVLKEVKAQETEPNKLAFDKDGAKVPRLLSVDSAEPQEVLGQHLRTILACVPRQQLRLPCSARKAALPVFLLQEDRIPNVQGPVMNVIRMVHARLRRCSAAASNL